VQTLDSFVSFDGLYKFNDEKMFKQFMQVNNQYELLFNFKNDIVKKKNELIKFLEKIFFKKVNDILLTEEEEVEYVNFLKNSFETDFKFLYTKIPFIYESKFYPFKNNSEYYKKLYNFYNEYVKPIEGGFKGKEFFSYLDKRAQLFSQFKNLLPLNFFIKPKKDLMEHFYNYNINLRFNFKEQSPIFKNLGERFTSFVYNWRFLGITEKEAIKHDFFH
jgi:hypothetical protein